MPKFTIESTYRLPIYRHVTYEAATLDEACRKAIEDDEWEGAKEDYDTSGPTYITGAWIGEDTAYEGDSLPITNEFAAESLNETNPIGTMAALKALRLASIKYEDDDDLDAAKALADAVLDSIQGSKS